MIALVEWIRTFGYKSTDCKHLSALIVRQGPTALAVGAGGSCLDIFTLLNPFSPLSPSLWETARYRLKYCLKGPLSPKQPTNQSVRVGSSAAQVIKVLKK